MIRKSVGVLVILGLIGVAFANVSVKTQKAPLLSIVKGHGERVVPAPQTPEQVEDTLRFDDPNTVNSDAIGLTNGGTYQAAIRLTPEELASYAGSNIIAVVFYHHEQGTHSGRVIVYGQGTSSTPGDTLTQENYTVTGEGWYRVDLSSPVTIAGTEDIWLSVEITHNAGEYPLSVDAGPAVPEKGDWVFLDSWDELRNYGFDYNWDILGIVEVVQYDHDVGVTAINSPQGIYFVGDTVTPSVTVRNYGTNVESFSVVFEIYDEGSNVVYSDTQSVDSLDPLAYYDVTFTAYPISAAGSYTVAAWTILAGDENPLNDTLGGDFTVYEGMLDYLVLDLDPTPISGAVIHGVLQSLGLNGVLSSDPSEFEHLGIYSSVWICAGMYPNNVKITPTQGSYLEAYLQGGGRLYIEGGDLWGWDPTHGGWPNIYEYTGVSSADDGSADLTQVQGVANTLIPYVEGNTWTYGGENNWVDRLTPGATVGTAEAILINPSVGYNCGVAYDRGTWKTIGQSFEIGGLTGTVPVDSLIIWYADFLDIYTSVDERDNVHVPERISLSRNPVKDNLEISFSISKAGDVSVELFDVTGRRVGVLFNDRVEAGNNRLNLDVARRIAASGVYFLKLSTPDYTVTKKVVIVK